MTQGDKYRIERFLDEGQLIVFIKLLATQDVVGMADEEQIVMGGDGDHAQVHPHQP